MPRRKTPNDVKAMARFYAAIKDEPFATQKAAVEYLASRIYADEAKRIKARFAPITEDTDA